MKYFESKKRFLLSHANKAFHYVSLGDSIAAGHAINYDWYDDYGVESQYGKNGNTSTVIIPGTYTDLIGKELRSRYGDNVSVTSFAQSGDTVADLIGKLSHVGVIEAIAKADLVTICIGANDILGPALDSIEKYIDNGDLSPLAATVAANLAILDNDSHSNSYVALLNRLNELNPTATYIFTTIYNPYKYLYLDESTPQNHYKDGFLGPLLWAVMDSFGDTIADPVRAKILQTDAAKKLYDRVNRIGDWAEPRINELNRILKSKVALYTNAHVIDAKLLFESVPDRQITADHHYNDLVNVEFTRGWKVDKMNWGHFWENVDWANILDGYEVVTERAINNVIENVIQPEVDPHPRAYGHELLKRAFEEVLGWKSLTRYTIAYNANGGSGSMTSHEVIGVDNRVFAILKPNEFNPTAEGYYFNGWDNNATYFNGYYYVWLNSNTTISAQWSNSYKLVYRHSRDVDKIYTSLQGSEQTGPQECYELWIARPGEEGAKQVKLGAFANDPIVYTDLPYGTGIGIVVRTEFDFGSGSSYITLNGKQISGPSKQATLDFTLTKHTDVNFNWNRHDIKSYWTCEITTY